MDTRELEGVFQAVNAERSGRGAANLSNALKAKVEADIAATEAYIASTPALQRKFAALGGPERAENARQYVLDLADFQDRTGRLDKYPPMDPHLADLMTTRPVLPVAPPTAPAPAVSEDRMWTAVQKMKGSRNAHVRDAAIMLDEMGRKEAMPLLVAMRDGMVEAERTGATTLPVILTRGEEKKAVSVDHWSGDRRAFLRKAAVSTAKFAIGTSAVTLVLGGIGRAIEYSYSDAADVARRDAAYVPPKGVGGPQATPQGQKQEVVRDLDDNPFAGRDPKGALIPQDPARQKRLQDAESDDKTAKGWRQGTNITAITAAGTGGVLIMWRVGQHATTSVKKWWTLPKEMAPEVGRNLGSGMKLILEEAGLRNNVTLSLERGGPDVARSATP